MSLSLSIRRPTSRGTARFEADLQGLRLDEPSRYVELPWSAVRAVVLQAGRRGRATVVLDLADGSQLQPTALQAAPEAEAQEVERLWQRYGPPAAPAMWGRAPSGRRPIPAG